MSIHRLASLSLLGLMLVIGVQRAAAQNSPTPPVIDIPDAASNQTMLPAYIKQIDDFTKFYAKALLDAKTEDAVKDARLKMQGGYNKYENSVEYKREFARLSGHNLLAVFDAKGPLAKLVQTNAALIISGMPQATLQGTLDKMAVHRDPVVRFFGWRVYTAIRSQLVAQSKTVLESAFNLLAQRMPKETSAPVVGEMLDFMNFSSVDISAASDDVKKLFANEPYNTFMKNWPAICGEVLSGNEPMTDACREGAGTLVYFAGLSANDKGRQKAVLQAMADILWCTASSYDKFKTTADKGEGTAKTDAEAIIESDSQLLAVGENALNAATGKKNSFVQTALSSSDQKYASDRGAAVKLAVLQWVAELNSAGVVQPKFAEPASPPTSPDN